MGLFRPFYPQIGEFGWGNPDSTSCLLVLNKFLKTGFIGLVKELWKYILLPLLPSEWICYTTMYWFFIDFQDGVFYESPMNFPN